MCRMDKYGFPATSAKEHRVVYGFQTGDIVKAIVPSGKKSGCYVGRVAIRGSGSFNIQVNNQLVQGIGYRYCVPLHRSDGYSYQKGEAVFPPRGSIRGLQDRSFDERCPKSTFLEGEKKDEQQSEATTPTDRSYLW